MKYLDIIAERDARDRLTDKLGFGITAPIQNLPLPEKTLATPFDTPADISLDYTQTGVHYRLSEERCGALDDISDPSSQGGPLTLKTENITEDHTYSICAYKNNGSPVVALNGVVKVRVGLDIVLDARVLTHLGAASETGVRVLDPAQDRPYPDTAARLAPYGTQVRVQIDDAQEGIDYTLENEDDPNTAISQEPVRGRGVGQSIELHSQPLTEDIVLRIRAQRGTNPAENQRLDIKLPMKLMANSAVAVSVVEGAVAPYLGEHSLRIAGSQASVQYQIFARPIPDIDYRPSGLPENRVITVKPVGEPRVTVKAPPPSLVWEPPSGYTPITDPVVGNGGDLVIPLPAAQADQVLLVRADKQHTRPNAAAIPSSVRQATATALLVRPNPGPMLALVLNLESGGISVESGEPGVYYYLRHQEAPKPEYRRPAYVHKRDPINLALNKGIGESATGGLTVGVDLSIARDPNLYDPVSAATNPTTTPPLTPVVEAKGQLKVVSTEEATLYIRGQKAQTGISQPLDKQALVPVIPEIVVESNEVETGTPARFTVKASQVGERYELRRTGGAEGSPQDGNGNDLAFESGAVDTDTLFTMRITRPQAGGLPLARELPIQIWVRRGG